MIYEMTSGAQSVEYWKQERLVLNFGGSGNGSPVHMWSSLQGSYASPIATYHPDTDGYCLIDVTDYLRTYGGCTIYLRDPDMTGAASLAVTIAGLINPANVIIPYHWSSPFQQTMPIYIVPPRMMIETLAGSVAAEFNADPLILDAVYLSGNASWGSTKKNIVINGNFGVRVGDMFDPVQYTLRKRQCGVEYAQVRWESFTGVTREHTFEVIKPKTETLNAYDLLPIDGGEYATIKGRQDSFVLRLNSLSPYDLWYYSDVITSSRVEVSLDGLKWRRVQVTTKNITLPDGDTKVNGRLEVELNYSRYDAVTM